MTEIHKTNFRQRPIDNAKPLQLIKDMNEVLKGCDSSNKKEYNIIEREIKNILELYDKKKTIIIPKAEKIDKQTIAIAPSGATQPSANENFAFAINYNQAEYERPKQYILFSEKKRKESILKEYEGNRSDMTFLAFEKNFMSLGELEEVIVALENDIGSGEQIPIERIKEIIVTISPEKAAHVDKLTKYFITRREEYKKSLLRKYWKEQKTTDKFLTSTYRRRDREKMKTRRNKQSEGDSIQKLREIKDTFNHSLNTILSSMKLREDWKHNLIKVNHLIFLEESAMIKGDKTAMIAIEADWTTFNKTMGKIILNEKTINGSLGIGGNSIGGVNNKQQGIGLGNDNHIATTSPLSSTGLTNDKQDNNKTNHSSTRIRHKKINKTLQSSSLLNGVNNNNSSNNSNLNTLNPSNPIASHTKAPISTHSHSSHPHNHIHHNKKEENHKDKRGLLHKKEENEKEPEHYLKLRLRINRANQLVIDRYIQSRNSFSPFDDSITLSIGKYKELNEDLTYHNDKEANFDNLYNEYLKGEIDGFGLISDSDDDNASFQNHIKNFQTAHKQFLKFKRGHSSNNNL